MARKNTAAPSWMELMESCREYALTPMHGTARRRLVEPAAVHELLAPLARGMQQEGFLVLCLDAKNGLINLDFATVGLVDRTQIHPREVFRMALLANCSRIILAHNHPSGDPTPSAQDIAANRQLVEAGKIIGIEVLDHVVIANPDYVFGRTHVSFRQENLM